MSDCALCEQDLGDAPVVSTMARFGRPSRRVACSECGLVQVDPQPSREELEEYYRSGQYRIDHGKVSVSWYGADGRMHTVAPDDPRHPQAMEKIGMSRARETVELLGLKPGAQVLDVGCGPGLVLDALRELGMKTFGVEPDLKQASIAATKGHVVHGGTLEQYAERPRQPYDAVVSYHVLEHVHDPVQTLKMMHSLILPQGGQLLVEVPNGFHPNGRLDENHFQWVHLFDFSEWTLSAMLQNAGFYPTRTEGSDSFAIVMTAMPGLNRVSHRGTPPYEHTGDFVHGWLTCYRKYSEEAST